ncbi:hypothetical protein Cgig2_026970 [Carnegiea gigantea]|uniref:Uncharacterized protein n=1 Tax=Carnegiea gigantea TaxID=171969 RepID=A0A9Q1KYL1_9CARY|nr:hypothetical protein Cgig2_026970 [Carnegiea gigantea]
MGAVSREEDIQAQGKEVDFSPDMRKVMGQQERFVLREVDYPRSSVQQFVAMFGGEDPGSSVNVESSHNRCGTAEHAEERVQELTLGHYNAGINTISEGHMMESMMDELQAANQTGFGFEAGSSHEHPPHQVKGSTTSSAAEDLRLRDNLAQQPSDHKTNVNPGHSTYKLSSAVWQNPFPSGGMRMKVISRSSGYPEYFVKSTLMGKGVLYRGPIPAGAEFRSQETINAGAPTSSEAPVDAGETPILPSSHATSGFDVDTNREFAPVTSDPPVRMGEKSIMSSTPGSTGVDPDSSRESFNDGVSLRDWIKSGQSRLHKVDSLVIFKQILDLVHSLHSEGKVLVDLRPSFFRLLPGRKVKYCGRLSAQKEMHGRIMRKDFQKSQALKRPLEQGMSPYISLSAKHQKFADSVKCSEMKPEFQLGYGLKAMTNDIDVNLAGPGTSSYELEYCSKADSRTQSNSSRLHLPTSTQRHAFSVVDQLEAKWYRSPEELFGRGCSCSSNVYSLGVFLFENGKLGRRLLRVVSSPFVLFDLYLLASVLPWGKKGSVTFSIDRDLELSCLLSSFDSTKVHAAAMSDLRHRILPPNFLSENPKEAGFCLWLLHPEPSLRPTARDILQSEVVSGFQALCGDDTSSSIQQDEGESELLLHFLMSMKEQKQRHASKLMEDLGCVEADISELEKRHLLRKSTSLNWSDEKLLYARERGVLCSGELSNPMSDISDSRFLRNVAQLENAYFSMRSQIQGPVNDTVIRADRDILKNRGSWFSVQMDEEKQESSDSQGAFFDGLCKYARYSKLEVCGTLRNRDITNSTNVICSLSFDRDEDYFAAAGVAKKIKIFEFQSLYDNAVDIHYPVIEMSNKSRLSCVCWNKYIRNYLASTDYDGLVKIWDASTGQALSRYTEHDKRAWSVDFSQLDPTKLASGSDDCSVKLWSINEFSAHSSNLLAFGSADYKIYCYDLRNANLPWCILAGHERTVSYVKFVDSATLVSASTDNTLKLWDLSRSSPTDLSHDACSLTLSGHANEKNLWRLDDLVENLLVLHLLLLQNFVGLSVADGYIACGSETNEVYTYYKSLPMPITSHKFGSIDPISGKETDDDHGQFVSSVCWKGKSNVIVAANSSGCIKVLRMV